MGDITGVYATAGDVTVDGIQFGKINTQVRWDFGIGSIGINESGKIVLAEHDYPDVDNKARIEKSLLSYTGSMDTINGTFYFLDGQMVYPQLSQLKWPDDMTGYAYNLVSGGRGTVPQTSAGIHLSLTDEAGVAMMGALAKFLGWMMTPLDQPLEGVPPDELVRVNEFRELYQTGTVADSDYGYELRENNKWISSTSSLL